MYNNSWQYVLRSQTDVTQNESVITVKADSNGKSLLTYPVIFTDYAFEQGERVQTVEAFNDALHLYAFGKRTGSLSLGGAVVSTRTENDKHTKVKALLVDVYNKKIRAYKMAKKGQLVQIAGPGSLYAEGVISNFQITAQAQQANVLTFRLSMLVTDSLGSV